ncbi:hypothetical protein N7471_013359 [Penicillium samsonianum]|uniref:uncharacterized protein n=1 Tax=Penicillium samsonianum TaxID=1882272 RepID=UPI00254761E0|nr:uncharacterized protein N7471_013359 [Penicillium samsonianum]KAJ6118739.1 hypothetical protein N7471_013359 [Penicillium samsonianum]
MSAFRAWQADLFLLEQWQEDSSLSIDAQREQILAKYMTLGVRGRQPYREQQRRLKGRSVQGLPPHSQELLNRVRQPSFERQLVDGTYWLRTCYEPFSEDSWAEVQSHIEGKFGRPAICNDSSLYNFGSNWEKIFLRLPQLLDCTCPTEEYEEYVQEALQDGTEAASLDPQAADESGYDPEEDENPWPEFYSDYHMRLVAGRIHIVDATTLASEGSDAGTVLVLWFDQCGRAIRYSRESLEDALDIANVSDAMLNEYSCWANAQIGQSYEWGAPLGPPYENSGESSG